MFPDTDPERWRRLMADPSVTMLVAEEEGELLGFTACGGSRDPDSDTGEVWTFFIRPASWRRGAGRALMGAALAALVERGHAEATVWSFADNDRANAFYESQGFSRDGAERTEQAWAHITEVRYRRALP